MECNKSIPIAIAFDENYALPASVMLISLFRNANPETNYKIHIFAKNAVKIRAELFLKTIVKDYPGNEVIWIEPGNTFETARNRKHLTGPNYYRFLIPAHLKQYEKVIWLDVDTIVKSDLKDLYEVCLRGKLLAAVPLGLKDAKVKNVTCGEYFNAGVLLINNKLWLEEKIDEVLKALIRKNVFNCPTQDPLNIIGLGRTVFLATKYNVLSFGVAKPKTVTEYLRFHSFPSLRTMIQDASIIHYVGEYKPWNYRAYKWREEWFKYYELLPKDNWEISYTKKNQKGQRTLIRLMSCFLLSRKSRRKFRDKYL